MCVGVCVCGCVCVCVCARGIKVNFTQVVNIIIKRCDVESVPGAYILHFPVTDPAGPGSSGGCRVFAA